MPPYFKETRFNAWAMGELYVTSPNLIPNARRDDFEKNHTFAEFISGVRDTVGSEITYKIRLASKNRNNPAQKALSKVEREVANVEEVLATGFHSSAEKKQVAASLDSTRRDLYTIPKNAPPEVVEQKTVLMERLSTLKTEVDESSNFRVKKDIPQNFSKSEKKVVQAMMQ